MDFKQLKSFVTLVDYRNFSRAAEKLNIAQSSVSTHLKALEKELGAKLLYRTTKTIEVTDIGWKIYKYARRILELEDDVYQTCSGNSRRILRIAASTIPATYILPGVLQRYRELFPNDSLKITQCLTRSIVEGVFDKRFDAGLIGQYVKMDGLNCVPLCRNHTVLIAPVTERYLDMQQRDVPITEWLKEPVILHEEKDDQALDLILERLGLAPEDLTIAARVSDQEAVKNMVAGGMGISVISEIAAQDYIKSHRILKLDLSSYVQAQNVYLIYPDGCTPKDRVWSFIDYVKESKEFIWK